MQDYKRIWENAVTHAVNTTRYEKPDFVMDAGSPAAQMAFLTMMHGPHSTLIQELTPDEYENLHGAMKENFLCEDYNQKSNLPLGDYSMVVPKIASAVVSQIKSLRDRSPV